jgi:diguanylate cyclase (GGDEF)-like protein
VKVQIYLPWLEPLVLGGIFSLLTFHAASDMGPVAAFLVSFIGFAILCYRFRSLFQRINELSRLVIMDDLTGLPNDRSFREDLATNPVGLIVFDIDQFKWYNDTFGHPAGDDALHALGVLFKTLPVNAIYRLGGDEFASMVFVTNPELIERQVETIREAIRNHNWPLRPLTASFGIAIMESGDDPKRLRIRADQALYNAKRNGGDCIDFHYEAESS